MYREVGLDGLVMEVYSLRVAMELCSDTIVRMLRLWLADLRVALLFFLLYIVVYEGVGRVLLYWVLECVTDIYVT